MAVFKFHLVNPQMFAKYSPGEYLIKLAYFSVCFERVKTRKTHEINIFL
jgi:hypothetical protein